MSTQQPTALHVENTNMKTAEGVNLSEQQKTLVGSVLDLFAGRPSLKKLSLWEDDATFEDPITIAKGREQYAPQWYGLAAVFSEIERQGHQVTSAGNPITMDMKTRYVVKGLNQEKVMQSVVQIHTNDQGKITLVQDKWDGSLPDGGIKNVSVLNPWSWLEYYGNWGFWAFSFVWYTWPWMAFRRLNANSVPHMVKVPKNDEEDHEMGFQ